MRFETNSLGQTAGADPSRVVLSRDYHMRVSPFATNKLTLSNIRAHKHTELYESVWFNLYNLI